MKILVTNTAALNAGDAAILYSTIDILRRAFGKEADIIAWDPQAPTASRYHPEITFRPTLYTQLVAWGGRGMKLRLAALLVLAVAWRRLRWVSGPWQALLPGALAESLRDYASADLVVSSGGTYLIPNYYIAPKIFDYLVTLALGRPLVFFTQSLGPFPAGRNRRLLRFVFRRSRLILVRDERSRGHLVELGVSAERIVVGADAAFALAPARLVAPRRTNGNARLRVAISVRDWPFFQDATAGMERYLRAVAALTDTLVERYDAEVTFLSTCQGVPEYWTDDSRTAEQVLQQLAEANRSRVSVDRCQRLPGQLIERFQDFDIAIATRMHAAILALCAGIPVLPIAYEFKTKELFERLGLGRFIVDIDAITDQTLVEAFERYCGERSEIDRELWPRVARERDSALAAAGLLRALAAA